jgi:Sec-independent protein translocase protein TatA
MNKMKAAAVCCRIRGTKTQLPTKTIVRPSVSLLRQQHQEQFHQRTGVFTCQFMHTHVGSPWDDQRRKEQDKQRISQLHLSSVLPSSSSGPLFTNQVACYHSTPGAEKAVAIVLGLGAVSALAYAGSSAVKAYKEYQASLPSEEELAEMRKQQEEEENEAKEQEQESTETQQQQQQESGGTRENVFAKWFGVGVGAKYYEGGFEDSMTRREAALILGVRESSPPSRIKEAHRRLLVLNHPDTGGSTYVAGKINEAKELLLKGRRGK